LRRAGGELQVQPLQWLGDARAGLEQDVLGDGCNRRAEFDIRVALGVEPDGKPGAGGNMGVEDIGNCAAKSIQTGNRERPLRDIKDAEIRQPRKDQLVPSIEADNGPRECLWPVDDEGPAGTAQRAGIASGNADVPGITQKAQRHGTIDG